MPEFRGQEVHFAAIILFIEIIIKKLMEMTKIYRNPEGEMIDLSGKDKTIVGPYIKIERTPVKEIKENEKNNTIIFQRGYSIDFLNLYHAEPKGGDNPAPWGDRDVRNLAKKDAGLDGLKAVETPSRTTAKE